ncbi:MAG: hypothetical protein ACRC42_01400 [Mycoplasma sp.]
MNKKKWKSRKWQIVSISEHKYNPYKDVSLTKERPVLIWNNAMSLNGKVICFYCTSKFNANNNHLIKINSNYINSNKDTYIDMTKIFFVKAIDINWKSNWGTLTDHETKMKVNDFIKKYFKTS